MAFCVDFCDVVRNKLQAGVVLVHPLILPPATRWRSVRLPGSTSAAAREEYKGRTATLNTIVEQSMLSDPDFRELMTEILGEMAGTPFEGLRTLDPGEVR